MGSQVPRLLTLNLQEKYMKQQYLSSKSINIMFATPLPPCFLDNSPFLLSTKLVDATIILVSS